MEFGVGSILDGKVTGITKFGAFVALPEGSSGLVHISEIAYSYVNERFRLPQGGAGGQGQGHRRSDREQPDQFVHQEGDRSSSPAPRRLSGQPSARQERAPVRGGPRRRPTARRLRAPACSSSEPGGLWRTGSSQFMQASDSKLSELRYLEKQSGNRRAAVAAVIDGSVPGPCGLCLTVLCLYRLPA
ncbi:MAG: S1 RNA-binding domain-containing protein [Oscillospiraceae bacterium]